MALTLRQTGILKWNDLTGGTRTNTVTLLSNPTPTLGAFGALQGAMQAASVAGLMYAALQPVVNVNEAPTSGPYPSVTDALQLIFRTTAGTTARLNVPAPLEELFKPNHEDVDFTNPLVVAIVEAAYDACTDAYGNQFAVAVSGRRMKIRIPSPNGG